MSATRSNNTVLWLWSVVFFVLVGSIGVLIYLHIELREKVANLTQAGINLKAENDQLERNLEVSSSTILSLENTIANIEEALEELEDDYRDEKDRNEEFEDQIRSITGTVRDLDKLSKTDEELLQKYSKVYFLNENFVPSDLDKINNRYILEGRKEQYFHGDALEFLEDMVKDARNDDIDLYIISGYRSFDSQTELKGQHTQVYGSGANAFSADQGYSEHQLGTAVDFSTPEINGAYESFAKTEAYEWLLKNAYKYGFILSYTENNSFYVFEPWHWRFVGVELARDLHKNDQHFYDLEQRELDEYLLNIFD